MKIWELSVKRPVFMSSILAALMAVGYFSFTKIPVELFPDITFPIVTVQTIYPGAGPTEIETLISKPIEEEMSTISGIKNIRSVNRESVSVVIAEFNLDVDIKYAEQQVRDKAASARKKLPDTVEEPIIRRVDPSAQPIMVMAIKSNLTGGKLFDLANEQIRPRFEQVNQVGLVEVVGGRKREIQVQVDRDKIARRELSVTQIVGALKNTGQNVPAGKVDQSKSELVFRTLGEFNSLDQIKNSIVSFFGNDSITKLGDVANVVDVVEDEKLRVYINGESSIFLNIYKQSGANTISVANGIHTRLAKINEELKKVYGNDFEVLLVRDTTKYVWANVYDVGESIIFGIILTILVVYLFLGSIRSTLITGFAIPVALIGSFALLNLAGMTINIMSLLAFSLAVGLLIDDAIVVRENIFRHLEMGKSPVQAALDGTAEVGVAVIAVTLAVLAVFAPIAFLAGVVGQFFKSFGLAVCFVMIISLFDALSNAPMLSAYFGGRHVSLTGQPLSMNPFKSLVVLFDRLQAKLENGYEAFVKAVLRRPLMTLFAMLLMIVGLASTVAFIPKTFIPANDSGEFVVGMELPPGATLEKMSELVKEVETEIRKNPVVELTLTTAGDVNGRSYVGDVYVKLTPFGKRTKTTTAIKEEMRTMVQRWAFAKPKVKDVDFVGAGQRPFVINIVGQDLNQVRDVSQKLFEKLKTHPALVDPEITDKPGLPEFQIKVDKEKAQVYGVSANQVGTELRAQIEGLIASKYRENGLEYDIRVRLQDDQRDLEKYFSQTTVPNLNFRPVYVKNFASSVKEVGFATINRENRARYVSIEADVAPKGPGMGGAIQDINKIFSSGEIKLPEGVTYRFVGQAENFQELGKSIMAAGLFAIIFIFLVLASLYESIVTPFVIMLVIPFAVFGGFFGLFVMQSTLDLFSMIGCIMLMGLATKNSIILVDYINQKLQEGAALNDAIVQGCKTRLRPILMTSLALVAGMLPVAIGLNEASSQRKSLGIAVVGGVLISTLLTLVLIPAVFSYIERGRQWMIKNVGSKLITQDKPQQH
ncbi:MAG: efflux RND transporter permease subunit [Bdellovibrionaceae bacterium]|nr:efflux RND transporter permease subunit [Pseudobdellovibrionaceae bacterium]